jgi:hypothetical protein
MNSQILDAVDDKIKKFKADHRGESPLYIIVSPHETESLLNAVKKAEGYDRDTLVTAYKGSKIVEHGSLKKGDLLLTNELPGD